MLDELETKHTPGPWRHDDGSIVTDEVCIAVIEDDGGYEASSEEREANGKLIAAAPDYHAAFLSVCNRLEEVAAKGGTLRDFIEAGALGELVRAYAKATF